MHQMDKQMEFGDDDRIACRKKELQRWYDADIKEHRRAFYIKQALR